MRLNAISLLIAVLLDPDVKKLMEDEYPELHFREPFNVRLKNRDGEIAGNRPLVFLRDPFTLAQYSFTTDSFLMFRGQIYDRGFAFGYIFQFRLCMDQLRANLRVPLIDPSGVHQKSPRV